LGIEETNDETLTDTREKLFPYARQNCFDTIAAPSFDMKKLCFFAVFCISTAVMVAKDIELQTSTTITSTVFVIDRVVLKAE
jgi:hypothetical protein